MTTHPESPAQGAIKPLRDRIADILWDVDEGGMFKGRYLWERCARYADALIAAGLASEPQPAQGAATARKCVEAIANECANFGLIYGPDNQPSEEVNEIEWLIHIAEPIVTAHTSAAVDAATRTPSCPTCAEFHAMKAALAAKDAQVERLRELIAKWRTQE